MITPYLDWKWKFGVPADIWLVKEAMIGRFIKENKLKAVERASLGAAVNVTKEAATTEKAITIDYIYDPRGGRKTPHLHYKGDLYLLDKAQWAKFTHPVLKELSSQLASVETIPFENMVEVSQAIMPHL